jgi:hypothetical protein
VYEWVKKKDALLQIVNRHILKINLLRTIDISRVSDDAYGHPRAGDVRQLDGAREPLVPLRVVVLEADLELDGLDEVAPFGFITPNP